MAKITNTGQGPRGLPLWSTKKNIEIEPGETVEFSNSDLSRIIDRPSIQADIASGRLVVEDFNGPLITPADAVAPLPPITAEADTASHVTEVVVAADQSQLTPPANDLPFDPTPLEAAVGAATASAVATPKKFRKSAKD